MSLSDLDRLGLPRPPGKGPKLLVFDIENAPNLGYYWGPRFKTNILTNDGRGHESYLLGVGWKWYGENHTHWFSIYDDPAFEPWSTGDGYVAERLWYLMDTADIVCGHNMERFDARKANALFMRHDRTPPAPYEVIDTLKSYRQHFAESSYKLADIGVRYGLGEKVPHHGIALWLECMAGEGAAWRLMERYCRQDVRLTEDWYEKLLPWIGYRRKGLHPNLGHWAPMDPDTPVCPNCGQSEFLIRKGKYRTFVSEFQSYWCKPAKGGCGAWPRARLRDPQSFPLGGPQAC